LSELNEEKFKVIVANHKNFDMDESLFPFREK
jgi:hypothetical protein